MSFCRSQVEIMFPCGELIIPCSVLKYLVTQRYLSWLGFVSPVGDFQYIFNIHATLQSQLFIMNFITKMPIIFTQNKHDKHCKTTTLSYRGSVIIETLHLHSWSWYISRQKFNFRSWASVLRSPQLTCVGMQGKF